MANMELIDTKTAGSGGASYLEFTSIPSTYTDLMCVVSLKSDVSGGYTRIELTFNGSTTGYSERFMYGIDGNATSGNASSNSKIEYIWIPATRSEAVSTFGNCNIYIPNYAVAQSKSVSTDFVTEGNISTSVLDGFNAGLWANNATISSLKITSNSGLFVENSTAYLYGISNVTSGSKATGGIVSSDGTYWYHMFPFSGTFTPTTALSADILCIAGGGGGGNGSSSTSRAGGGGGAGGLVYSSSQSLTATGYTVTVGAGGTGGNNGNLSSIAGGVLSTISATAGGAGAAGSASSGTAGNNGGSGGGGIAQNGAGGTATSGQGNNGGIGRTNAASGGSGGGGGAGAVGANGVTSDGGNGGAGLVTYSSFANATQTGVNGYYAGGGGGAGESLGNVAGIGGVGGGGKGGGNSTGSVAGTANTGGGGGGGTPDSVTGNAGGSGLVIIRYAI